MFKFNPPPSANAALLVPATCAVFVIGATGVGPGWAPLGPTTGPCVPGGPPPPQTPAVDDPGNPVGPPGAADPGGPGPTVDDAPRTLRVFGAAAGTIFDIVGVFVCVAIYQW